MKNKNIEEETNEEKVTEETTEEGTIEEAIEEGTGEAEKMISNKVDEIIKAIKDTPARKAVVKEEIKVVDKTIVETDSLLRKTRPFVRISGEMKSFVDNIKILARGGVVKTVIQGDDTQGGFLVPEEFKTEVIRYATESAIVRPRARVISMATDKLSVATLDQSAGHFGGVAFTRPGEAVAGTPSNPNFGKITLNVTKLIGLCSISNEMLRNSAINIANYLVNLFGEALAYQEDLEFLTANGAGKPLGIIADSRVPTVTRATANRIRIKDIVNMYVKLPAYATANAVWTTTKEGVGQLMQLRADAITAGDQAGAMIFQPSMTAGVSMTLYGKPILETDKLPAVGTRGDLIFGDYKNYFIGDKGAMKVASSSHERFTSDEIVLRFIKEYDGQLAIPKAFVVLK